MTKREYNSQPEMLEGAKLIGAGAATIASAGAAIGIGNVFSSLIHSVARNPSLATTTVLVVTLTLLGGVAAFYLHSFRLKGPLKKIIYLFLVFFIAVGISLIRIKAIHLLGLALPLLVPPLVWNAIGGGGEALPSTGPNGASSYSEWFTYTSDLEDSASSGRTSSSVNQPIQREQAGPSNALPEPAASPVAQQQDHLDQPFGEGGEREARAQEHDRISAEVETITSACENLEAAMVRKAHILLHQRGVTLGDPEDVKRALQLALHDDWEHDIDDRKRHFTVLRRDFGTARCERWNPFIDELRGLGNRQVNARHYVD
jgi:F0F1-type ATP synthase membrane subunit c/vacuolar-type H+-ATPase subunit K